MRYPSRRAWPAVTLVLSCAWAGLMAALTYHIEAKAAPPRPSSHDIAPRRNDTSSLFDKIRPSVFVLRTVTQGSSEPSSIGSAFFVSLSGQAVTNYHVVEAYVRKSDRRRIEAVMADGHVRSVHLVSIDPVQDLALVEVDLGAQSVSAVTLEPEGEELAIGSSIHAFGTPLNLGVTVMSGHYSGLIDIGGRRPHPFLRHFEPRHERRTGR